eukprot:CAMPEP_0183354178 /NCGR_PEP_ID=MMETSP0164_2-20130417/37084_1 /TAXON_ID=221442 /ORGANISM="Coccolithus pelagicus ssp braarudi, Strain PLY182g" /LENGTH=175 /DNA_ID=CAMNT_0025527019 /DNA_START=15 /DNA_END=542 /DNA_ORIENTATION=+
MGVGNLVLASLSVQAAALSLTRATPRVHQRPSFSRPIYASFPLGGGATATIMTATVASTALPANAATDAAAAAATALPSTMLLAEDSFGSVFFAGMCIAFASLVTTVIAGFIVRSKYDEIEQGFFDAQDDAIDKEAIKAEAVGVEAEVTDFFSDTGAQNLPQDAETLSAKDKVGK